MALHGHTILELENRRTGRRERVEKHNLVTGAAAEIFTPVGTITRREFVTGTGESGGLTALFGGLVLFDRPLGGGAATIFPPAAARVVGTAAYNRTNDGDNLVRGSYNGVESVLTPEEGLVKLVYDFTTQQANGSIGSVCLCNAAGAYFSAETAAVAGFNTESRRSLLIDTAALASKDFGWHSGWRSEFLELDEEKDETLTLALDSTVKTTALTLNRYAAQLRGKSLFWGRGAALPPLKSSRTVTLDLPGWTDAEPMLHNISYRPENRTLYLTMIPYATGSRISLAANARFAVIGVDVDTGEQTRYDLTNQTGTALTAAAFSRYLCPIDGFVYDGFVYYTAGSAALYKIALNDGGDVRQIEMNGLSVGVHNVVDAHDGRIFLPQNSGSQHCLVLNAEQETLLASEWGNQMSYYTVAPIRGRSVLALMNMGSSASDRGLYLGMRPNYLATVNDLAETVEKTADKTMKITYILREGGE